MINIDTCKVSLPLKKKFAVSKGSAEVKTNVLTILNNRYYGEASGSVYYGPSLAAIEADLRKGIEQIKKSEEITAETLLEIDKFDIKPIARSALIGMVLNYLSGETGRYPWELLTISTPVGIRSSMTFGIDDPSETIKAISASEFPIIKVKMGSKDDLQLLDMLKSISDKEIRVDANGGWDLGTAEELIFLLARQGIRIIEQPTDPEHIKEWRHLKTRNAQIELIVDEGMNTLKDYQELSPHCDGVNIKMEKCGGILEALRIAGSAQCDGKKVMLGCMVESSVGIAQSVYMSALADYWDLDGPQLLEHDIASGIVYNKEVIQVDREIIGGPKLKRDVVEKYLQP